MLAINLGGDSKVCQFWFPLESEPGLDKRGRRGEKHVKRLPRRWDDRRTTTHPRSGASMSDETDDDVKAISTLISVLKPLDKDARVHVLEFVLKRLGIVLTGGPAAPAHTPGAPDINPTPANPSARPGLSGTVDIRSFAVEKNPQTVNEKVAVVGYYLAHLAPPNERRDHIVADDIETYFIQADFHLPSATPNVTLTNAKNAGYLNSSDRGQFKLNSVGYNLVAHKLPASETKPGRNKARPKAKK